MNKSRVLVRTLLLALICAVTPHTGAQTNRPAATNLHSLWKVEGKSNVVYLLGSVHLLKAEDYPLAAPIDAAFADSQIVAFETDIAKMQQPDTQMEFITKTQLPAGETLEQALSPELYAAFSKQVKESGAPVEIFTSLKPAMAAMMLQVLELQKLGTDPEMGIDEHFFNLAKKENKKLVALETVEFQIGLLTDFSKEENELVMKCTLKDIAQTAKVFGDMVAAWKTGDAEKLAKTLNDSLHEAPAIYKRLVSDRSLSWVPKIEEMLRGDKNAIVIVGAGHLVGSDGVVEMLKKKGLKVTQQ